MARWKLAGSTAMALVAGSALQAQVTPEEVWQNWKDMGTTSGQVITTTAETRTGDTLLVEGMLIALDQEGVKVNGTIDEIRLTDQGDGTVAITMSDSYPLEVTFPPEEGETEATTLTFDISQPGLSMIASGTAAATSYAFDAPTLNVRVAEVEGVSAQAVDLTMDVTLTALKGAYDVTGEGEAKTIDSTVNVDTMAVVANATDPGKGGSFALTATVADLAAETSGSLLGMAAMSDMAAAMKAGFATSGSFSYGSSDMKMDVTDKTGPTSIAAKSDSGSFNFAMDATRLGYGFGGKGTELTMSGAQIPFPELTVAYAEMLFDFAMPVAKSDQPSPFSVLTRVVDLTVSDEVWGMIDPAGALPRDPATVIIDAAGTATLDVDILDPVATEALGDAAPGTLNSLDLNEVRVAVAGAELTGQGALTFDNSDTTTFPGMPLPTGKIDMKLVGGNALIDKLVGMGLLPDDQAMGARMMLGMFARPGEGTDTLTSVIEFKDKGLFANGQKLQ